MESSYMFIKEKHNISSYLDNHVNLRQPMHLVPLLFIAPYYR